MPYRSLTDSLKVTGIDFLRFLVDGAGANRVAGFLRLAHRPGHDAREARAQTLARRDRPRRLLAGQERPAIEIEQALHELLEPLAVADGFRLCRSGIELPRVDEEVAPVEGDAAFVQHDRAVLSQELPQPVERAREGAVSAVAVDARPQRIGDAVLGHLLAAARNDELEELERPALRLAGRGQRLVVAQETEPAEGLHLVLPGPDPGR